MPLLIYRTQGNTQCLPRLRRRRKERCCLSRATKGGGDGRQTFQAFHRSPAVAQILAEPERTEEVGEGGRFVPLFVRDIPESGAGVGDAELIADLLENGQAAVMQHLGFIELALIEAQIAERVERESDRGVILDFPGESAIPLQLRIENP